MWRTAATPKWLGLLVLVLGLVVGFGLLGRWQLDVAQQKGIAEATREAATKPAAPLTEVIRPDGSFPSGQLDRAVTVTGRYVPEHQLVVTGRRLDGRQGYWVVTALAVDGAHGSSSAQPATIPVLRGFVVDPAAAPPPPTGTVRLSGVLSQSEPPPDQFRPLPEGQVQTINVPSLLNRWGGDMFNAFVFLQSSEPSEDAALSAVPPPPPGKSQLDWRNLGYALQWFFFAVFAVYMWWRMVLEESRDAARAAAGTDAASPVVHDAPEGASS